MIVSFLFGRISATRHFRSGWAFLPRGYSRCDDNTAHLLTHALTTVATVHEARCTAAIHAALAGKGLVPAEHLVGPPRGNPSWQGK